MHNKGLMAVDLQAEPLYIETERLKLNQIIIRSIIETTFFV